VEWGEKGDGEVTEAADVLRGRRFYCQATDQEAKERYDASLGRRNATVVLWPAVFSR